LIIAAVTLVQLPVMLIFQYAIVILVEALAIFYVARFFYRTFAESARREGVCGGNCGCGKAGLGKGATKPIWDREEGEKPYLPPHISREKVAGADRG
jgi:hypothetical protein